MSRIIEGCNEKIQQYSRKINYISSYFSVKDRKLRVVFMCIIFFYVINIPQNISNNYHIKFNFSPDSTLYITSTELDPWKTYRTPGYPLVCALFFSPETHQVIRNSLKDHSYIELFHERHVEKILVDSGLEKPFVSLVIFQRLVQAASIAFFFMALCEFFPTIISFCALTMGLFVLPLANPYNILTETLAQSLIFSCLACLFFFKSKKNFLWMYGASLLALMAWCVRPGCMFMVGICFLDCSYLFFKDRFHHRIKYIANIIFLVTPCALYIAYLSLQAGGLVLGTVQDQTNLGRVLFFLEREDLENMPTYRSKLFARAFLDNYAAFVKNYERTYNYRIQDKSSPLSVPRLYNNIVNSYIYGGSEYPYAVLRNDRNVGDLNILQRNILVLELQKGIIQRHMVDNMILTLKNFLSGFGYYKDFHVSKIANSFNRKIFFLLLLVVFFVLLGSKEYRYCLIMLVLVHVGNIAVCSTHYIESRYVNLTEVFFGLAILLSLMILLRSFIFSALNFLTKRHTRSLHRS